MFDMVCGSCLHIMGCGTPHIQGCREIINAIFGSRLVFIMYLSTLILEFRKKL